MNRKNNHQTITAEGIAKRKNSHIPLNSSIEMGARVFAHAEEYLMYNTRKITFDHIEMLTANAPPTLLRLVLNTKAHDQMETEDPIQGIGGPMTRARV